MTRTNTPLQAAASGPTPRTSLQRAPPLRRASETGWPRKYCAPQSNTDPCRSASTGRARSGGSVASRRRVRPTSPRVSRRRARTGGVARTGLLRSAPTRRARSRRRGDPGSPRRRPRRSASTGRARSGGSVASRRRVRPTSPRVSRRRARTGGVARTSRRRFRIRTLLNKRQSRDRRRKSPIRIERQIVRRVPGSTL